MKETVVLKEVVLFGRGELFEDSCIGENSSGQRGRNFPQGFKVKILKNRRLRRNHFIL
jgi:hypothetical protein